MDVDEGFERRRAEVEREDVEEGTRAAFLKVIVHLTSSPAKTTCSCQRTKTRMLLELEPRGASGGMVRR